MRISEIYTSLQGEGLLAGTPSTFVRTSGCNLRCVWCDTPFTSWKPEGGDLSVGAVLEAVVARPPRHVVVTGGEPLLVDEIPELCGLLGRAGYHVTVETAGSVPPAGAAGRLCDLVSISPKLASSTPPADTPGGWAERHEAARRRDDVLRSLVDRGRVFLMPQARTPEELAERSGWLVAECDRLGFRYAPRHHLSWYGGRRGT